MATDILKLHVLRKSYYWIDGMNVENFIWIWESWGKLLSTFCGKWNFLRKVYSQYFTIVCVELGWEWWKLYRIVISFEVILNRLWNLISKASFQTNQIRSTFSCKYFGSDRTITNWLFSYYPKPLKAPGINVLFLLES